MLKKKQEKEHDLALSSFAWNEAETAKKGKPKVTSLKPCLYKRLDKTILSLRTGSYLLV